MASIIIGGETVSVSLENYAKLKKAWKYIEPATTNPDFVSGMDAIIGTIAVGLATPFPDEPPGDPIAYRIDHIDNRLTGAEIPALKPFMNALLIESGLAEAPGEVPAVTASPSTETSTPSSPS